MSFENYIDQQARRAEQVMINTLNRVGQEAVNEARNNGSYEDQTGNLRSSIGYVVVKDGQVLSASNFEQVEGKEKSKEPPGNIQGEAFANQIARQTSGLALIVVAGMNYAKYVEAHRNVLTSAELLSEKLVPDLLRKIGFKV